MENLSGGSLVGKGGWTSCVGRQCQHILGDLKMLLEGVWVVKFLKVDCQSPDYVAVPLRCSSVLAVLYMQSGLLKMNMHAFVPAGDSSPLDTNHNQLQTMRCWFITSCMELNGIKM
jgi:hypothetical protein